MNVFFDLEIEDFDFFHSQRTETEEKGTEEIRCFIEQRIGVLKEEIEREEIENKASYTLICIIPEENDDWHGTVRFKYSKELTAKMISCFSEKDWIYLTNRLKQLL